MIQKHLILWTIGGELPLQNESVRQAINNEKLNVQNWLRW